MDKSRLLPLTGILIFTAVLLNVDLPEIAGSIISADPFLLLLAALIHIPLITMKAGKWKVITHAFREAATLRECLHAWMLGFVIGIARPISWIWVGGAGVAYLYVKLCWRMKEKGQGVIVSSGPKKGVGFVDIG